MPHCWYGVLWIIFCISFMPNRTFIIQATKLNLLFCQPITHLPTWFGVTESFGIIQTGLHIACKMLFSQQPRLMQNTDCHQMQGMASTFQRFLLFLQCHCWPPGSLLDSLFYSSSCQLFNSGRQLQSLERVFRLMHPGG